MKMYPLAENTIDREREREKCDMHQEHNEIKYEMVTIGKIVNEIKISTFHIKTATKNNNRHFTTAKKRLPRNNNNNRIKLTIINIMRVCHLKLISRLMPLTCFFYTR